MKTDKITIVGGGSSGWMVAAYLIKTFPEKDITVIESPTTPIIGVGESTLADFTQFRDYLGLDEKEFMKSTDASYKMSIKFTDFYDKNGEGFHYPFGYPYLNGTNYGMADWLEIKAYYQETPNSDFVKSYFPSSHLFENNKFATNQSGYYENYTKTTDVSYHFDAVKFATYLKEKYCMPRNVKHISANVIDIVKNKEEEISYLLLDLNNSKIASDLFIDCTGFKSLLLGQAMNEKFISYSDIIPNNRSWAAQLPYLDKEKELEPYTHCTAIENGWCWNTPLWSRLGTGYVYSDKHTTPEKAKEEFKQYLMSEKMTVPRTEKDLENITFRDIPMKIGIYERTWVKNVVAIGLSSSFCEPLESNGLFSVIRYVSKLSKTLLRGEVSKFDIDIYNIAIKGMYDKFVEFVAMHYALSIRRDTAYWVDISNKTFSKEMAEMKPAKVIGFHDLQDRKMFLNQVDPAAGITYISVGMNYPFFDRIDQRTNLHNIDIKDYINSSIEFFSDRKRKWSEAAKLAPTLYEYLKNNIYN
jgi:tryptophan halogenase